MKIPLSLLDRIVPYAGKLPMKLKVYDFSNRAFKNPAIKKKLETIIPRLLCGSRSGKVIRLKDAKYRELADTVKRSETVNKIFDNYVKAMHKRRDYTWPGLKDQIDDSFYALKDPLSDSFLIQAYGDKQFPIFHPSHFSPETLRGGQRIINLAARSSKPTVFTVTEDLAPMLEKSGFVRISEIPMPFGDLIVNKVILANKAVAKDKDLIIKYFSDKRNWQGYANLEGTIVNSPEFDKYIELIELAPNPPSTEYSRFLVDIPTLTFKLLDLILKKLKGGNLYQIDNSMPLILQRYLSLLNLGINPLVAFDTAHLSLVEDSRPNKFYSFGKRSTTLDGWTQNTTDSLTIGRYKNLLDSKNFDQYKLKLKLNHYNSRPAFYNIEMNRNRNKDKQIINTYNQQHNLPLVALYGQRSDNYIA